MMKVDELIHEAEQLPTVEKWRLVKQLLRTLEKEQQSTMTPSNWHEFLVDTYGSLQDTPIERWDQGEYEVREPLE